jgi:hypothetical protein
MFVQNASATKEQYLLVFCCTGTKCKEGNWLGATAEL